MKIFTSQGLLLLRSVFVGDLFLLVFFLLTPFLALSCSNAHFSLLAVATPFWTLFDQT